MFFRTNGLNIVDNNISPPLGVRVTSFHNLKRGHLWFNRSNGMNITLYKKNSRIDAILLMAIPLLISAFTHLWNPVGFPGVQYDEARYIESGVRFIEGSGSQDPTWLL